MESFSFYSLLILWIFVPFQQKGFIMVKDKEVAIIRMHLLVPFCWNLRGKQDISTYSFMISTQLTLSILAVRVSTGWDVPMSLCPGTKKNSCPDVPLSWDKYLCCRKCRRLHSWDPSPPHVCKRLQLGTPSPPKNCGRPLWTAPNMKYMPSPTHDYGGVGNSMMSYFWIGRGEVFRNDPKIGRHWKKVKRYNFSSGLLFEI